MCARARACVCVYIYIYIYMHVGTTFCRNILSDSYAPCVCMVHTYIHAHTYTQVQPWMHPRPHFSVEISACPNVSSCVIYTKSYIHTYTHTHSYRCNHGCTHGLIPRRDFRMPKCLHMRHLRGVREACEQIVHIPGRVHDSHIPTRRLPILVQNHTSQQGIRRSARGGPPGCCFSCV